MKFLIESFLIAFAMYSSLPVKCLSWNQKNLKYALVFFPFVGILAGIALIIVWELCNIFSVSSFLYSVLSVLSVVLVTGGIHLDGFCDTADALYSRRPVEQKLKILKDPNCGPFAVFSVILVLLVSMGAFSEIYIREDFKVMFLITGSLFLSRVLSGISVTSFKCAATSSLAKTFGENAGNSVRYILIAEFLSVSILLLIFFKWFAVVTISLSLIVFIWYYFMSKKQFGGITGDIAGFFLVICETVCELGIAILGGVMA
jgi:adenosylcobinamide-GDP ribazoletransferase